MSEPDASLSVPLWALLPLGVAQLLVGVRGVVSPEVIAFTLALTVVIAGRFGGRAGGALGAVMASTGYDFFHTEPYLLLEVFSVRYLLSTVLLLIVGFTVGALSSRAAHGARHARQRRAEAAGLTRVLSVAADGGAADVERAVRVELLELLDLQDCRFTHQAPNLVSVDRDGAVGRTEMAPRSGELFLPPAGVALPVSSNSRCFGYLAAVPVPGVAVTTHQRRIAVAMAGVLGLAMAAESAAP